MFYGDSLTANALAQHANLHFPSPSPDWLCAKAQCYTRRWVISAKLYNLPSLEKHHKLPWFIKPASDKVFAAKVYSSINDPALTHFSLDPHTPVYISEPVEFQHEWRFFIGNRDVKAFSIYARYGKPFKYSREWEQEEEDEAFDFIRKVLADTNVTLLPSQVIDIGCTEKGWAVVETNESWASAMYACEPGGVLDSLECIAQTAPRPASDR
ncbi:MAG: ATP-grasp domain-containing protein [Candidatus Methylacidiphilales bacterium]